MTKSTAQNNSLPIRLSYWLFIGLLAYMPLHIFLSTWLGTSFGALEVARVLKDLLMLAGFLVLAVASLRQRWFKALARDRLVLVIVAYGLLSIVLAIVRPTDMDAEILGLVYNSRYLVFFLYAAMLAKSVDYLKLRRHSLMVVLGSALVVLVFGLLQYTVIPNDYLKHFGYERSNGVLPAFFIDDKSDLERVMSTLRDPNSYGSYIIIIASMALVLLLRKPAVKGLAAGFLGLSVINLWFSFSRSAWLGFLVSCVVVFVVGYVGKAKARTVKKYAIFLVPIAVVFVIGIFSLRNTYFVQNVIFHADQSTVLEDPNELRIRFWQESVNDIAKDPVGSGPGTAGLASIRNNVQGAELNENYYLQIASEVGILGLTLFISILVVSAIRLYGLVEIDWLAVALLASFAGLLITNFLVHIWSNEAVAYTWWGLAGLIVYSPRISNSHNKVSS